MADRYSPVAACPVYPGKLFLSYDGPAWKTNVTGFDHALQTCRTDFGRVLPSGLRTDGLAPFHPGSNLDLARPRPYHGRRGRNLYRNRRPGATRKVVGFIPFGDEPTFPQLSNAEGHTIIIAGVVGLDGGAMITMTDTNQLMVED
jgi:hypothetical protein